MTKKTPTISVVMPMYNAARYLKAAIDSILSQSFTDFEFIIIDDASTDNSAKIVSSYKDKRIRLYKNKTNQGVGESLNKGVALAKGRFIARMDADDISLPSRFSKQIAFLAGNHNIGVLGTWVEYIDKKGKHLGIWHTPTKPAQVHWKLLTGNALAHSSVVIRREIITKRPYKSHTEAEDYELWTRLSRTVQLSNLPEILVKRRVTSTNQTSKNDIEITRCVNRISLAARKQLKNRFFNNLYLSWVLETRFSLVDKLQVGLALLKQ